MASAKQGRFSPITSGLLARKDFSPVTSGLLARKGHAAPSVIAAPVDAAECSAQALPSPVAEMGADPGIQSDHLEATCASRSDPPEQNTPNRELDELGVWQADDAAASGAPAERMSPPQMPKDSIAAPAAAEIAFVDAKRMPRDPLRSALHAYLGRGLFEYP